MSASTSQLVRFLQQENSRLKEEKEVLQEENIAMRRYMEALEALHQAAFQITSEQNLMDLLDQILYNAMNVLQAEDGSLSLLDEETDELVFVLVHGDISDELQGFRMKSDEGIGGWVATNREALIVNDVRQDRRFFSRVDDTFNFSTQSILCVPMVTRNKLIGVIELVNKQDGGEFSETDSSLLSILAHIAAIALEEMRIKLEEEEPIAV
ncbi:MAG: GAF domain-containing protein [Chloroflexota bacterium]